MAETNSLEAEGSGPLIRCLRLRLQGSGYIVELTRPDMVLGRHTGCDIRLPLPDVSRRHCRFSYRDGGWFVYDLQSMNGVYVNAERVAEACLKQGDLVGIGGFKFEVQFGDLVPVDAADTQVSQDQPIEQHIRSEERRV